MRPLSLRNQLGWAPRQLQAPGSFVLTFGLPPRKQLLLGAKLLARTQPERLEINNLNLIVARVAPRERK